jgi:hypothetical protein
MYVGELPHMLRKNTKKGNIKKSRVGSDFSLTDAEIKEMQRKVNTGEYTFTPVFTPATQEEIEQFSKLMGQFLRVKE